MIKVLYIISTSCIGGATLSVLALIEGVKRMGCQVVVASPDMEDYFRDKLELMGVSWHVVDICMKAYPQHNRLIDLVKFPFSLLKMIISNYVAKREIEKIIINEKIDIVHTNVGPITVGYEACKKLGIPHVWHVREYGDKDFNIKMFPSKKKFRQFLSDSYVISITKDLIKYNRLEGLPRACTIYNGVRKSSDIRNEYPKDNYFLCASRINPEKGFDQVFHVFARFHNKYPDYRLKIIGTDPYNYKKHLIELANKLKIENYISFEGYKDNVSDYMAKARALLVASPFEGFGRMTAEAAFAGCAVVGKNTAGTKEILDITGGFPFITDKEMFEAMEFVCSLSESEYQKKVLYAQRQAVSHFSEESYVGKIYSIYNNILLNSKNPMS